MASFKTSEVEATAAAEIDDVPIAAAAATDDTAATSSSITVTSETPVSSETTTSCETGEKLIRPSVIVFDLDGCLWEPEMYQLWGGGPPFEQLENGDLKDCRGTTVSLIGHMRQLLMELHTNSAWEQVPIGLASTCDEPEWAHICLDKFILGKDAAGKEIALIDCLHPNLLEIHKGLKSTHLKNIQSVTDVPFNEIVFFDNEWGNCVTVKKLGVNVVYCPSGICDEESWLKVWEEYPFAGKILEI